MGKVNISTYLLALAIFVANKKYWSQLAIPYKLFPIGQSLKSKKHRTSHNKNTLEQKSHVYLQKREISICPARATKNLWSLVRSLCRKITCAVRMRLARNIRVFTLYFISSISCFLASNSSLKRETIHVRPNVVANQTDKRATCPPFQSLATSSIPQLNKLSSKIFVL